MVTPVALHKKQGFDSVKSKSPTKKLDVFHTNTHKPPNGIGLPSCPPTWNLTFFLVLVWSIVLEKGTLCGSMATWTGAKLLSPKRQAKKIKRGFLLLSSEETHPNTPQTSLTQPKARSPAKGLAVQVVGAAQGPQSLWRLLRQLPPLLRKRR